MEWPIEVLIRIGFHERDAARLRCLLPPVQAHAVASLILQTDHDQFPYRDEPAAQVVWATHNVTLHQAICLTRAGRGLLDVLVILDAVREHVHHRLSIEGFDTAVDWAIERRVPRDRLRRYIALGFPPAKAAALESDTSSRPSEAALEVLAALRLPQAATIMRSSPVNPREPAP